MTNNLDDITKEYEKIQTQLGEKEQEELDLDERLKKTRQEIKDLKSKVGELDEVKRALQFMRTLVKDNEDSEATEVLKFITKKAFGNIREGKPQETKPQKMTRRRSVTKTIEGSTHIVYKAYEDNGEFNEGIIAFEEPDSSPRSRAWKQWLIDNDYCTKALSDVIRRQGTSVSPALKLGDHFMGGRSLTLSGTSLEKLKELLKYDFTKYPDQQGTSRKESEPEPAEPVGSEPLVPGDKVTVEKPGSVPKKLLGTEAVVIDVLGDEVEIRIIGDTQPSRKVELTALAKFAVPAEIKTL